MILSSAQAPPKIEDLAWMQGTWQCEVWGGTFEEHWTAPRAGTMLGVGRHIEGEKTGFMEFLSIEPSDDGLTMWIMVGAPSKGDKKPVAFRLTQLKDKEALFENPQNDFPSQIRYRMRADGNLFCRIEGKGRDGKPSSQDFDFKPARSSPAKVEKR